jgi:hypothetical protein
MGRRYLASAGTCSHRQERRWSQVADSATSAARAAANDERLSPATRECLPAPARELAQRLSGTVEVLLLWHPEIDRVELSIRDPATGADIQIEVAPGNAIDAFNHPYAYAARSKNSYRVARAETTILDG